MTFRPMTESEIAYNELREALMRLWEYEGKDKKVFNADERMSQRSSSLDHLFNNNVGRVEYITIPKEVENG